MHDEPGRTVSIWMSEEVPQLPALSTGAHADVCVVGAGIAGGWLTTRTKVGADLEIAKAAREPNLQTENIAWTKELLGDRQEEIETLREQLDKEREHRFKCMEQIAEMRGQIAGLMAEVKQIDFLKARVADLEKEILEVRGRREDVR